MIERSRLLHRRSTDRPLCRSPLSRLRMEAIGVAPWPSLSRWSTASNSSSSTWTHSVQMPR